MLVVNFGDYRDYYIIYIIYGLLIHLRPPKDSQVSTWKALLFPVQPRLLLELMVSRLTRPASGIGNLGWVFNDQSMNI